MHIVGVPVAGGYKKGLSKQISKRKVFTKDVLSRVLGKYGLPTQAPGGKTGTPDIVFAVDDLHIVIELATIKAKSLQFSAEGSSVPDHIRLYQQETGNNVVGVFCAPTIHERNTAAMKSTIAPYGIELHCISNVLFVVSSLLKDVINKVLDGNANIKQVFVLTHNVYFHKELSFMGNGNKTKFNLS